MPDAIWVKTFGKQRAVWAQPGGTVWVNKINQHFQAVVIESGIAARQDVIQGTDVVDPPASFSIPIMVVPAGAKIVKTVAMAAPASFKWDSDADSATWAVDDVHVEEDTGSRRLSVVATFVVGGKKCGLERVAYHVTIFIEGRKYVADPNTLEELETA